jgi:hypothetical protein
MRLDFGKHRSRSVERVVLEDPDYAMWMATKAGATGRLRLAQEEVRHLIRRFNKIPLICECQGEECGNLATRCVVYRRTVNPTWWCDDCDPYSLGASEGKLMAIRGYRAAVDYCRLFCDGRRQDIKTLIKELAQAKGLPEGVGELEAKMFFHRK